MRSTAPSRSTSSSAPACARAAATLPRSGEPLHLDEAVMLDYSHARSCDRPRRLRRSRRRAAQFLVEHVTLWPGGIEGLRLPSLVFFLLALPVAAAVARGCSVSRPAAAAAAAGARAARRRAGDLRRMYALFLLCVLGATWLASARPRAGPRAWAVARRRCRAARLRPSDRAALRAAALLRASRAPAAVRTHRGWSTSCVPRWSPGPSSRCRTRTRSRCSARATTSARRPVCGRRPGARSRRRACTR